MAPKGRPHALERALLTASAGMLPSIDRLSAWLLALAMQDGYSTGRSLGLGLPGAKRLMDEFEIVSEIGNGTTVTMVMWAR